MDNVELSAQGSYNILNLPHQRNPFFTGREALLAQLRTGFSSTECRVQVISGPSGIGKTQLALEYAYRFWENYEVVWWVFAENTVMVKTSIAALAEALQLPERDTPDLNVVSHAVKKHLLLQDNWLLIFDNLASKEDLQPFLPEAGNRHVLITSIQSDLPSFPEIRLAGFFPKEAIDFLVNRTRQDDRETANAVAIALGNHPLALEQAAAYISQCDIPYTSFIKRFLATRHHLWEHGIAPLDYPDGSTICTMLHLAADLIKRTAPAGQAILNLCACFAPNNIPRTYLQKAACTQSTALNEDLKIDQGLMALSLFSIIAVDADLFSIHALTQDMARRCSSNGGSPDNWVTTAIRILNESWPADESREWSINLFDPLLRHACALLNQIHDESLETAEAATLSNRIGNFLHSRSQFAEAEPFYSRALRIREQLLGEEHPDTLRSLNNLGVVLRVLKHYDEAESMYTRALALRKRILGPEHPETLSSLNNLGVLYRNTGRHEKAEILYQTALEIRERILGREHPDTLRSVNNLGALYRVSGRYDEAEALYTRALEVRERTLGSEHPETLRSINNLAFLYQATGRYEDAEPLYQHALALNEHVLGKEHPDTLSAMNNLAGLLSATRRFSEAEPLYKRALDARERVLGMDHPDTLSSVNNLGVLYRTTRRYRSAETLYRRALESRERVLGNNHPDTLRSINNLASLYCSLERFGEAEPLYQRALEVRDSLLGPDHPDTLSSVNNLAGLFKTTERYAEAEPLYQRALAGFEKILGKEHPTTRIVRFNVLSLKTLQKKPSLTGLGFSSPV